jgi:hypothetical protein
VRDLGLATERTSLSRRRTTIPFLVVALLGARAALDAPVPGAVVAVLACLGAGAAVKRSPTMLAVVVVLLALAALAVPAP